MYNYHLTNTALQYMSCFTINVLVVGLETGQTHKLSMIG